MLKVQQRNLIPDRDLEIIVNVHCLQYKEPALFVWSDLVQDFHHDLIARLKQPYERKTLSVIILIRPCCPVVMSLGQISAILSELTGVKKVVS